MNLQKNRKHIRSLHEIKAFTYLKDKGGWNDLNLRMVRHKYALYLFCLLVLTYTGCKNNGNDSGIPVSAIETNPLYKSLNDSIKEFPGNASLYLRRAIRLTQE